ncbi:MAG: hypothetical protein ACHQ50_06040 [Fimbriimonadales bacterium]
MGQQVFDRFPAWARLVGFLVCGLFGGAILLFLPDDGLFSLVFFVPALFMLLWRNALTLRFDGRSWSYQMGLWPILMRRNAGSFDDLNDIEVDTHLYEPRDQYGVAIDDAPSSNTYTAFLRFKDESIGRQPLLSGRSFGEAAKPAAILAHRMRIPVMLGRGSRGYDSQLSECVERAQNPDLPGPGY